MGELKKLPKRSRRPKDPDRDRLKAPEHLSARARAFWDEIVAGWDLDAHQRELLRRLCEAIDRADEARGALEALGLVYDDRFGQPRARPEVAIERDSRIAIARLTRELALDPDDVPGARPPRQGGTS